MKRLFIVGLAFMIAIPGISQDMKWPEDRATAELKVAVYSDELAVKNYKTAAENLQWILVNAPDLHLSVYQNGAKIYENLMLEESDEKLKTVYRDSLMTMYDLRLKYFGDSVNVLNRKAFKAYKYFVRDQSQHEWLLELFDNTVKLSGEKTLRNNLPAYMNVVKVNKLYGESLSMDDVFSRYNLINEIIAAKAKNGEDLKKEKDIVDKLLLEAIPEGIDCDFVNENLGPRFEENPDDLNLSKQIMAFMLDGKCTDDPLFLDVAKAIQKQEPNYGLSFKLIAKKCMANEDFECARLYLNESLELATDLEEKAAVYLDLGRLSAVESNEQEAREYYRNALKLSPNNPAAYNGIGSLYYASATDCAVAESKEDLVNDRLPYIAAYGMFEKAGNSKMMDACKEQFPSREEVFNALMEVDQVLTAGCWINETVKLKTRD